RDPEFDVSLHSLASEHDVRPLVLRTALTYLELLRVIRQGTPFYAGYRFRPLVAVEEIPARFDGERGRFVARLLAEARLGREWYSLDPAVAAEAIDEP